MKKVIYTAFIAAVALSMGCAITNYPLITDSAGPWGGVLMDSYYDKAYIIPSGQIATLWADGSDLLFTLVTQDWKGDQRLYTYNNFDPTQNVIFLDQDFAYCDPTRQTNCPTVIAWNADLPDEYPTSPTGQSGSTSPSDDPFDYFWDTTCPGARSLSLLVDYGTFRIGECGSGVRRNAQDFAREFALLEPTTFNGKEVYALPLNSAVAEIRLTSAAGTSDLMPIYGSYDLYLDAKYRMVLEPVASWKYQARYLNNWLEANGSFVDIDLTYGSLEVNWKASIWSVN
jgi:hypothetical protein